MPIASGANLFAMRAGVSQQIGSTEAQVYTMYVLRSHLTRTPSKTDGHRVNSGETKPTTDVGQDPTHLWLGPHHGEKDIVLPTATVELDIRSVEVAIVQGQPEDILDIKPTVPEPLEGELGPEDESSGTTTHHEPEYGVNSEPKSYSKSSALHRISNGSDLPTPRASVGYPTPRASAYNPTPRASSIYNRHSRSLDLSSDTAWQKLLASLPIQPPSATQSLHDLRSIGEVPEPVSAHPTGGGLDGGKQKYIRRGSESSDGSSTHSSFREYFSSSSSGSDDEEECVSNPANEATEVCLAVLQKRILTY